MPWINSDRLYRQWLTRRASRINELLERQVDDYLESWAGPKSNAYLAAWVGLETKETKAELNCRIRKAKKIVERG